MEGKIISVKLENCNVLRTAIFQRYLQRYVKDAILSEWIQTEHSDLIRNTR